MDKTPCVTGNEFGAFDQTLQAFCILMCPNSVFDRNVLTGHFIPHLSLIFSTPFSHPQGLTLWMLSPNNVFDCKQLTGHIVPHLPHISHTFPIRRNSRCGG